MNQADEEDPQSLMTVSRKNSSESLESGMIASLDRVSEKFDEALDGIEEED